MDYNNLDKQSYEKGYKDDKQDAAYEIITQMRYINCNIIGSLGYENVEDYSDYLTAFLDSIARKYNVEEDEVYEL
jgi:hypothetical protein